MRATLVIEGELVQVTAAAALLRDNFPEEEELTVRSEQATVDGWTPEAARQFAARLSGGARSALTAVVEGGGFANDDVLRGANGESLRGKVTGPMTRHVDALIDAGFLPPGTKRPVRADYDEGVASFHRTKGLHMDPDLVRLFARVLRPELHENSDQDAEMTEAVLGVLRRHIPEYQAGAGIEHLVVAVRCDDEDVPERNTYVFTGSELETLMLLRRGLSSFGLAF